MTKRVVAALGAGVAVLRRLRAAAPGAQTYPPARQHHHRRRPHARPGAGHHRHPARRAGPARSPCSASTLLLGARRRGRRRRGPRPGHRAAAIRPGPPHRVGRLPHPRPAAAVPHDAHHGRRAAGGDGRRRRRGRRPTRRPGARRWRGAGQPSARCAPAGAGRAAATPGAASTRPTALTNGVTDGGSGDGTGGHGHGAGRPRRARRAAGRRRPGTLATDRPGGARPRRHRRRARGAGDQPPAPAESAAGSPVARAVEG